MMLEPSALFANRPASTTAVAVGPPRPRRRQLGPGLRSGLAGPTARSSASQIKAASSPRGGRAAAAPRVPQEGGGSCSAGRPHRRRRRADRLIKRAIPDDSSTRSAALLQRSGASAVVLQPPGALWPGRRPAAAVMRSATPRTSTQPLMATETRGSLKAVMVKRKRLEGPLGRGEEPGVDWLPWLGTRSPSRADSSRPNDRPAPPRSGIEADIVDIVTRALPTCARFPVRVLVLEHPRGRRSSPTPNPPEDGDRLTHLMLIQFCSLN